MSKLSVPDGMLAGPVAVTSAVLQKYDRLIGALNPLAGITSTGTDRATPRKRLIGDGPSKVKLPRISTLTSSSGAGEPTSGVVPHVAAVMCTDPVPGAVPRGTETVKFTCPEAWGSVPPPDTWTPSPVAMISTGRGEPAKRAKVTARSLD